MIVDPINAFPDILPDHFISDGDITILHTVKVRRFPITVHPKKFRMCMSVCVCVCVCVNNN